MALVTLQTLNGNHYLGSQEGEFLNEVAIRRVYFPHVVPAAQQPLEDVQFTQAQADMFMRYNYYHLTVTHGMTDLPAAVAICYHRLLAAQEGLISPAFVPGNHHVNYQEAIRVAQNVSDQTAALAAFPAIGILAPHLNQQLQEDISETFTDRVCLVAFVFRARGHHYMNGYEDLYKRVWSKCRYDVNKLHLSWVNIAVEALHAIYPDILDAYWTEAIAKQYVNGALAKRFDVAPAGAAGPFVLEQGIRDLIMIAPGIKDILKNESDYLDGVLVELRKHRFNGSVNAVYYGATKIAFNEKRLAAIAATILAAVDNLTNNAPIGQSPALKRIADNAPITGAVYGRAIGNLANDSRVINALMIESPKI